MRINKNFNLLIFFLKKIIKKKEKKKKKACQLNYFKNILKMLCYHWSWKVEKCDKQTQLENCKHENRKKFKFCKDIHCKNFYLHKILSHPIYLNSKNKYFHF